MVQTSKSKDQSDQSRPIFNCWGKEEELACPQSEPLQMNNSHKNARNGTTVHPHPTTKTDANHKDRRLDSTRLGNTGVLLMDTIDFREVLLLSSLVHCHIAAYLMDPSFHYH